MFLGRIEIMTFAVVLHPDLLAQVGIKERSGPLLSAPAVNVLLELLDGLFLFFEHLTHQVADRQHADHAIAFDHGQVADTLVSHQTHAIID